MLFHSVFVLDGLDFMLTVLMFLYVYNSMCCFNKWHFRTSAFGTVQNLKCWVKYLEVSLKLWLAVIASKYSLANTEQRDDCLQHSG